MKLPNKEFNIFLFVLDGSPNVYSLARLFSSGSHK